MFHFPFGTMHELNLDWFLQEWENYKEEWAAAQAGIDGALQAEIDRVEDAMTDLYNARDIAVQAKEDAETAAASVVSDAAQCGVDSLKAEGYAVGEQDGIPVGSGSPYYQQNAKYYKVEAGTYRYLSEAYAKGEMGGSPVAPGEAGYQDNAKYYKDAADADAQQAHTDAQNIAANIDKAEGYAVGTQGGVPVSSGSPYYQNNAAYYAGEAQQDKDDADHFKDAANTAALAAEGFSVGQQNGVDVGGDSPYYQNNAKYYASLLGSISESFGNKVLDEIMPTTEKTTSYSGRSVKTMGKRVSIQRTAGGSTYRWHIVSGPSTNMYDTNATPADIYSGGNFVECRRIYGASKIAIHAYADPANVLTSAVYYWVLTTADGGQTIHEVGYSTFASAFNPTSMMSINLTADQVADLATSTPEIAIMVQTRGGYESVRNTMTTYLEMVIT